MYVFECILPSFLASFMAQGGFCGSLILPFCKAFASLFLASFLSLCIFFVNCGIRTKILWMLHMLHALDPPRP